MSEEETTTWPEVCKHVGMADNLFPVCRKKVPGFFEQFQDPSVFDELPDRDFEDEIMDSALPVPPPPPPLAKLIKKKERRKELTGADLMAPPPNMTPIHEEPPTFFERFPVKNILLYGGLAATALLLINKQGLLSLNTKTASAVKTTPAG